MDPASSGSRLNSWKEIAAYLNRDVRTVRRWEVNEQLPVHRHLHLSRPSVYAHKEEIDAWWQRGRLAARNAEAVNRTSRYRLAALVIAVMLAATAGTGVSVDRGGTIRLVNGTARVAVLRFAPTSPAAALQLGDLFAEELAFALGRLQSDRLTVVRHVVPGSALEEEKSAVEVGRLLRADYVIDGSIQEAGDRLQLTVHLIGTRAPASRKRWSFDVPRSRLSRLAETAAANIGAQFQTGAAAGQRTRLARIESTDPQAYVQYLRGRHILNRRAGAKKALPYLQEAVGREPTFAPAHAALGEAYLRVGISSEKSARAEPWSTAEIAIRRALALDDRLAIAHATLGWLYMFRDWNWSLARAELGRAIELDPDDPNAHSNYAVYLRGAGRMDEAIEQRCLARDADPLSVELTTWLGNEYLFARRYAEAVATFEAALELEPAYIPALDGLADGLGRMGLRDRAAQAQLRLFNVRGDATTAAAFEDVYRRRGYPAAMEWLDRKAIDDYSGHPERRAWALAYTHARLGETDAALRYLAIAFEQRDSGVLQVRVDPDVDSLRADPRFQRLIAQLGIWP